MSEGLLLWGLFFSSLGIGYFVYGRRQQKMIPKYVGVALMVYPYFIGDMTWLIALGIGLCCIPFLIKQ